MLTKVISEDVLSRTIERLRGLYKKWVDVNLAILNLIAQLTALKAALNKIFEWISSDLSTSSQHHQLVMDLEDSMSCCRVLVTSMDDHISKVNWEAMDCRKGPVMDRPSQMRVFLEDNKVVDFQKYIERQTNALTLLLAACSWYERI